MASKFLAAAAWLLLITEAAARPQQPAAARLDDRLRDYVERFEQEASALVAEEHYIQRLERRIGTSRSHSTRELRSDYVLLKPADTGPWLGYRDIFEVDGEPVRDRDARLVALLSTTSPDSRERAVAFVDEGSRFNLGPERTVNAPTMPMQLLDRRHAGRIRVRAGRVDQRADRVTITFDEPNRPTIVRTPDGNDVWSRGELLVRASDGAILKATLHFRFPKSLSREESTMSIDYADVPGIAVPVPIRMTEALPMPEATATGVATYSNYRRFQTSVRIR